MTHVPVSHCQVYKFLYACRLLDWGLVSQAFHYCEVVGGALIGQHEPSLVLLGEVVKVASPDIHMHPRHSPLAPFASRSLPHVLVVRCL